MPVIELDIGGTPRRVQVDAGYTPDDLDHIVSTLGTATTTTPTTEDSALWRGAGYLASEGKEWIGAASRITQPQNLERPVLDQLGDWATAAAPVVAPYLTAAGVLGGTAARTAGLDPETAGLVESGVNLAGGVGSIVKGGISEAAGLRSSISQRYKDILAAVEKRGISLPGGSAPAQSLRELAQEHLGDFGFTKKTAERQTAKALIKLLAPGAEDMSFKDLDEARIALSKIPQASRLRGAIAGIQKSLVKGTPEGSAWTAVNKSFGGLRGKPLFQSATGLLGVRPGGLASNIVHGSSVVGELGAAGYEASQGRYKRAAGLTGAAVLGGLSPGQLAAFGRGTLGPAGRAATSFAQTPGVQSLDALGGSPEDLSTPSDLEDTPDEPTIQRTTPAPAGPTRDRRAAAPPGYPGGQARWEKNQGTYDRAHPGERAAPSTAGPFGREVDAVSRLTGVPAPLLRGVMRQESGGNPNVVSHPESGQAQTPAHGLMQITPGTFEIYRDKAEELLGRKADIHNPLDNLLMSGLLYRNYLDKTGGDVEAAARLYFGGGGTGPRTRQYGRDIASQYTRALAGR